MLLASIKLSVKIAARRATAGDIALLEDPAVWVFDTSSSMHSTPYDEGMTNVEKYSGSVLPAVKGTTAKVNTVGRLTTNHQLQQ